MICSLAQGRIEVYEKCSLVYVSETLNIFMLVMYLVIDFIYIYIYAASIHAAVLIGFVI